RAAQQPQRDAARAQRGVGQRVKRHDRRNRERHAQRAGAIAPEVGGVLQIDDVGGDDAPPGRRRVEDRQNADTAALRTAPCRRGDDRHLLAQADELFGEAPRVIADAARDLLRRIRRTGAQDAHAGTSTCRSRHTRATSRPTPSSASALSRKNNAWCSVSVSPSRVGSRDSKSRALTSGRATTVCSVSSPVHAGSASLNNTLMPVPDTNVLSAYGNAFGTGAKPACAPR